jgi:hypothetical protein
LLRLQRQAVNNVSLIHQGCLQVTVAVVAAVVMAARQQQVSLQRKHNLAVKHWLKRYGWVIQAMQEHLLKAQAKVQAQIKTYGIQRL